MLQNGPALVAAAGAFYRLVCFSGQLGGEQTVQHVDKAQWKGKTAFNDTVIDTARYQRNVDMLKIVDNDIRYKADSFIFNVAGAPEEVKQFSGISSGVLGTLVQRAAGQ
jgi:phosphoglycerol transferase MdoB-like AlkP superfamily enzyme